MKFIPIVVLFVLVTLFITIMPNIFGSFETQHNMTVTNYTAEYYALTNLTQTDMVVIGVVGTLLVIAMAYIIVKLFL